MKSPEAIQTILAFVVPGLVLMFFRSQFLTGRGQKHSDALLSYFVISVIYLAATLPAFQWISQKDAGWSVAGWIGLLFGLPALIGCLIGLAARKEVTRQLLRRLRINPVHPIAAAWDWKFGDMAGAYVLVTIKDGGPIAGYCGDASFISSDPGERDLYLEKVYEIDEEGTWQDAGQRSMLIKADEVRFVEFIAPQHEEGSSHGEETDSTASIPTHETVIDLR